MKYNKKMIPGLVIQKNFLTNQEQIELISEINNQEWNTELSRRTQHYLKKYNYSNYKASENAPAPPELITELCNRIEEILGKYPDQIIVNEYLPGQGISAHKDSKVFGNKIVSISLGSVVNMIFKQKDKIEQITLWPGDLLIFSDEARTSWTHEIKSVKSDFIDSHKSIRKTRISITFRTIL